MAYLIQILTDAFGNFSSRRFPRWGHREFLVCAASTRIIESYSIAAKVNEVDETKPVPIALIYAWVWRQFQDPSFRVVPPGFTV